MAAWRMGGNCRQSTELGGCNTSVSVPLGTMLVPGSDSPCNSVCPSVRLSVRLHGAGAAAPGAGALNGFMLFT